MTMRNAMVTVICVAAAGGCAASEGDLATDDDARPAPLASAARDGAQVAIYEVAPGDLMVVAQGELPDGLEGKTPVAIYEAIAGAGAPAALIARQAEIAAAQRPSAHVGSLGEGGRPAPSSIAELTAADFQSAYCNPGVVDFDLCFTNSTNDFTRSFFNIKWIHSHLNAYRGSVTQAMQYRPFAGSWRQIDFENTTGSTFVSTFNEQDNGDYEVDITNATGDGYHLSLHGDF